MIQKLLLPLLILSSVLLPSMAFAASFSVHSRDIPEIVRLVTGLYSGDLAQRYKEPLFIDTMESRLSFVGANWNYETDAITLLILDGFLTTYNSDEIILSVCHELGHLLGEVPKLPEYEGDQVKISVEGEADYFSGRCVVNYYQAIEGLSPAGAQEKAFFAAQSLFTKLYEMPVDARAAEAGVYPSGVNPVYPEADCRLLSVWNGIEGKDRPRCWYNPQ